MKKIENKIIQGDCLEVMRDFDSESVDLVVTSPPYDNLRDYKGYSFNFEGIAKELMRVIKNGGVIVWVVNDATIGGSETGTSFKQALYFRQIGLNLHDTMIYQKNNPMPYQHNRYQPCFEYMFIFSKGKPKTFNPIMEQTSNPAGRLTISQRESSNLKRKGSGYGKQRNARRYRHNVWSYNVGSSQTTKDIIAFEHPAVFPELLVHDQIVSWSNEGDLVLDPMNGSGTTTKIAMFLCRSYIGIDISQEYCDIANQRLAQEVLL